LLASALSFSSDFRSARAVDRIWPPKSAGETLMASLRRRSIVLADVWAVDRSCHTGLVWTKALLAAFESSKSIQITGTGTCDQFGVEQTAFIDFF